MSVRLSLSNGLRIGAAAITAALLSACGGHSGSGPLPNTNRSAASVPVKFHIVVPPSTKTAAATRKPKYVSPSTASATVTVGSTSVSLTCSPTPNPTACGGTVSAPIGSDTFTVSLYDAATPTPNLLSQGTKTQTIAAGAANTVNVTFNPVVAAVSFIPDPLTSPALTLGTAGDANLQVFAEDAAGNTIIGPGTFIDTTGNALTFGANLTNDAGSPTAFTTTVTGTAAKPGDLIVVHYTGATPAYGATVTPTVATGDGTPGALLATSAAPFKATGSQVSEAAASGAPVGIAVDPVTANRIWYGAGAGGINHLDDGISTKVGGDFPLYAAADSFNGILWFTDWVADGSDQPSRGFIYKVNATTLGIVSYNLTAAAVPTSIIYDSAANLVWFTERGFINGGALGAPPSGAVSAIGYLSPAAGPVTEFNVPGNPYGIVKGPDGNIWFTEDWNDKVGVITGPGTTNTLAHEYALSGAGVSFADSAKGIASDGVSLWVCSQAPNQIINVTTGGVVTNYALPAGTAPKNIIWIAGLGGTGRLVFTESGTGSIGILDPAKATPVQAPSLDGPITTGLTEIQLPNGAASVPTGLVAAADGSVWVTEAVGNGTNGAIAHITVF
jgi:streptogramin lyase